MKKERKLKHTLHQKLSTYNSSMIWGKFHLLITQSTGLEGAEDYRRTSMVVGGFIERIERK